MGGRYAIDSAPSVTGAARHSADACVAPPDALGVLIATAAVNESWLCAPPEANPNATCPCCWTRLPPSYDYRTKPLVGCSGLSWNPNW